MTDNPEYQCVLLSEDDNIKLAWKIAQEMSLEEARSGFSQSFLATSYRLFQAHEGVHWIALGLLPLAGSGIEIWCMRTSSTAKTGTWPECADFRMMRCMPRLGSKETNGLLRYFKPSFDIEKQALHGGLWLFQ